MNQNQFNIRLSITTKLLLTMGGLLFLLIAVLNISANNLFKNDKKSYLFDSQTTAAVLTGREFTSTLESSFNTLKLIIGTYDAEIARSGIGSGQMRLQIQKNLEFFINNQSTIQESEIYRVEKTQESVKLLRIFGLTRKKEEKNADTPSTESLELSTTEITEQFESLEKDGFLLLVNRKTSTPHLSILLLNKSSSSAKEFSLIVGHVDLLPFYRGVEYSYNSFAVVKTNGDLLFHSDGEKLKEAQNQIDNPLVVAAKNSSTQSGALEYSISSEEKFIGSYYKPGFDLIVLVYTDYEKAMQATYTLSEKFLILALATLGLSLFISLLFSKKLTEPIKSLFSATNEVAQGKFDINVEVSSSDEIGALSKSFQIMSSKIKELVKEMVDKARVDSELDIARTVQQSLFPESKIKTDTISIGSLTKSASECGGDWWGYFQHESKHIVMIADATGHGLPSALMTAAANSCFKVVESLIKESKIPASPSTILSIFNQVVYGSGKGKINMTCFAAVIDNHSKTITYSNAAHNPPWMVTTVGTDGVKFKLDSLISKGIRLGETPHIASPYEEYKKQYNPGDLIFFYTDGLLEGKNNTKEEFGKLRARNLLESNFGKDPNALLEVIMKTFHEFQGNKPYDDDITLAAVYLLK